MVSCTYDFVRGIASWSLSVHIENIGTHREYQYVCLLFQEPMHTAAGLHGHEVEWNGCSGVMLSRLVTREI